MSDPRRRRARGRPLPTRRNPGTPVGLDVRDGDSGQPTAQPPLPVPSPSAHSGRPVFLTKRAPVCPPGAVIAVYQRVCRCRHEATSPSAAWLSGAGPLLLPGPRSAGWSGSGRLLEHTAFARSAVTKMGLVLSAGTPGQLDICGCAADGSPPSTGTATLHVQRTPAAPI